MQQTCGMSGGVARSGEPCRASLNLGRDGRCLFHSTEPERIERARQTRAEGGRKAGETRRRAKAAQGDVPKAPRTLSDAERLSAWITHAVLAGELDVRVAEAATKSVRQFQLVIEKRVLQDRVRQLERALKEARK